MSTRSKSISTDQGTTERLLSIQRQARSPQRQTLTLRDDLWVQKRPIAAIKPEQQLDCPLTFAPSTPMSLAEVGQLISRICGYPVKISTDAAALLDKLSNSRSGTGMDAPSADKIFIQWRGPLSGFLDSISARLGVSWRFDGSTLQFFHLDTRTFALYAISSTSKMQSDIKSGTSESGSGTSGSSSKISGTSAQSTSVSIETALADDIKKTLQVMLTPSVGQMAFASSTGTITVTDTPAVLTRIEAYIEAENRQITRQVVLNIKVLNISLKDEDTYGIEWKAVYEAAGKSIEWASGGTEALTKIIAKKITPTDSAAPPSSATTAIIQALSTAGHVSVITSPSVTTLNMQPVPVQVGTQITYLAKITTTQTKDGPPVKSYEPGTLTTGFNMNLLPYVMKDKSLLLQFSVNLSELVRMKIIGSEGGDKLELPEVDTRIFSQQVRMNSGETLVLSGFEQRARQTDGSGVGAASNWLLGGQAKSSDRKTLLVILITPIVMD